MDFNLKQWKEHEQQHESENHLQQTPSAKLPKLLSLDPHHTPSSSALPLFSSEPTIKIMTTNMSACPSDSSPNKTPRIGSYFSLAQWQELELQAVIFRHMLVGAAIPPELLHLIKKSLFNSSYNPYYFTHALQHYSHLPPALVQAGYWGKGGMDPEPTRCRRTDGKKWRCSRDVVAGHKYCERHVHRGRNRSRKPVEIPTPPSGGMVLKPTSSVPAQPSAVVMTSGGNGHHFNVSGPSPSVDLLHFNNRSSKVEPGVSGDDKSGGQILRHFFDDWPRSLQESENAGSNASSVTSATSLSVSDFSLKLSTGADGNESGSQAGRSESQTSWASNQIAPPPGGPLAEALRSSTSSSSPTSVLHH